MHRLFIAPIRGCDASANSWIVEPRRWVPRWRQCLYLIAVLQGCQCDVDQVHVFTSPPCINPLNGIAIGDTFAVDAQAHAAKPVFIGTLLYSSGTSPGRFAWSVTPDSVATVTRDRLLIPRRPGHAVVRAATEGVIGETSIRVEHPRTFVRPEYPAQVRRGDTVAVRFDVRDSAGQPVELSERPGGGPRSSRALHPVAGAATDRLSLFAHATGSDDVWWCAAQRVGTVRITVVP